MALMIATNLGIMGVALPWVMGLRLSPGAMHLQRYFIFQAGSWALILLSSLLQPHPGAQLLSLVACICAVCGPWQMAQALEQWLGPRPLRGLALAVSVGSVAGFLALLPFPSARFVWFSVGHGVLMLLLASMCLRPYKPVARGWRRLLCGCATTMGLMLLLRSTKVALLGLPVEGFVHNSSTSHAFALLAQVCSTLVLIAGLVAWRDESSQQLHDMAMSDQLTGLANRRALLLAAPRMLEHAQRHQLPLALVLFDVDHFKQVNDHHGHDIGDQALQLLARVLQGQVRSDEMAARWGGEEFCVLMHADREAVQGFYTRLSHSLRQLSLQELGFALHLSAGCAQPVDASVSLHQLMTQADTALYQAKARGRDCLVFFSEPPALAPVAEALSGWHIAPADAHRDTASASPPPAHTPHFG